MRKIILVGLASICLSIASGAEPASANDCEANYGIAGSSFTNTTGWLNLGNVGFGIFNNSMKNKCKAKAIANCSRQEVINLIHQYAPVGSANFQSICASGSISIYYDTQVAGRKNSKDGTCNVAIRCTRPPCPPYTGYSALEDMTGAKLVQLKSTDVTGCQSRPTHSF
jgi:hypothetical protein